MYYIYREKGVVMNNNTKQNLLLILNAIVNKKVITQRRKLRDGIQAERRLSELQNQIYSLQEFISNNRYDRADTLEAENEIADIEREISECNAKMAAAEFARTELSAAAKFYETYYAGVKSANIAALQKEYDILDARADKLSDLMFACEINMDSDVRSRDLCEQSARDMAAYRTEYNNIMARMRKISSEIRSARTK